MNLDLFSIQILHYYVCSIILGEAVIDLYDSRSILELGKHPGKYYVPQRAKAGLDPWATPDSYDNFGNYFRTGVTYNTNGDETSGVKNLQFHGFMPMTNKATEAEYTCNGTKVSYRIAAPVRCVRDGE